MSIFEQIGKIFPYLISIRKLENYLSIDVAFPSSWKLPKKYVDEKFVAEQKTEMPNRRAFSFVSEFEQDKVLFLFDNLDNVIKYNIEREQKDELFNHKVVELRSLFDKASLVELGSLKFELNQTPTIFIEEDGPTDRGENT